MRRYSLSLLLLALAVPARGADTTEAQRAWDDSPVRHLLSREEEREYRLLQSAAEAERFVALFWARRDPDPDTPVNELREELDARVAAADAQFGYEGVRGALTDRGQALILLGAPSRRTSQAARASLGADGRTDAPGGADIWTYERGQLPVPIPSSQLHLVFRESRPSRGDFSLDRTSPDNRLALKVLADAPVALVKRPDLQEVPAVGLLPGSAPATAAELAHLAAELWPEGAAALAVPGVQSREVVPLWIHLELPAGSAAAERVVGRVRPADGGEAAGTFALPATAAAAGPGRLELAVPLRPGTWAVDLAVLAGGAPVVARTFEVATEPAPAGQPWISPVYAAGEVREDRAAPLGAPFRVGGWQLVPHAAAVYALDGSLELFGAVVDPPVTDGQAQVEVSMRLRKDGRTLQEVPAEAVPLSHVRDAVWMHGRSLPLAGLREAGDYELEVTVRDPASGAARSTILPVHIR